MAVNISNPWALAGAAPSPIGGTYNVYGPGAPTYQNALMGQFINPDVGASLQQTALTGRPTDVSGIGAAAGNEAQRAFRGMLGQINERYGALGLPSSSARVRSIARAGQGLAESLQNEIMRAGVGAQEAAQARMLQSSGLLSQIAGQRLGAIQNAGQLGQVAPLPGYNFGAAYGGGSTAGRGFIGGGLGSIGSALGGVGGGQRILGYNTTPGTPQYLAMRAMGPGGPGTSSVNYRPNPNYVPPTSTPIYANPYGSPYGISGFEGAHGGMVMGGVDTGEDTVPAMLRPGEVVVPPELVHVLAGIPALAHLIHRRPQMVDGMQHAQLGARIGQGYADPNAFEDARRGYEILQQLQYENPMLAGILQSQSDLGGANPAALSGFARYVDQMSQPEMLAAAGKALMSSGNPFAHETLGKEIVRQAPKLNEPVYNEKGQIIGYVPGASQQAYLNRFDTAALQRAGAAPQFDYKTGQFFAHGGQVQGFQEGGFSDPFNPAGDSLFGALYRYIQSLGAGRTPAIGTPAAQGQQAAATRTAVPAGQKTLPGPIPPGLTDEEMAAVEADQRFAGPPGPGQAGALSVMGAQPTELERLTQMRDDAARRYGLLRSAIWTGTQGSNENLMRLAPLYQKEFELTQGALAAHEAQQFNAREALQKAANELTVNKAQALRDRSALELQAAEMQRRAMSVIAKAEKPEVIIAALRNFKNLEPDMKEALRRYMITEVGGDPDADTGWWGSFTGLFQPKSSTVTKSPEKAQAAPGGKNPAWERFGASR